MLSLLHVRCGPPLSQLSPSLRRYYSLDDSAIQRLKNPTRGGQNLSLRYRRLEKSLRGKEALQRDIRSYESDVASGIGDALSNVAQNQVNDASRYIRGFEIPQRPKPPESDECCMSGCAVCVYDLYEESLGTYTESMAAFRSKLAAAGIPEASWPDSARSGRSKEQSKKSVTLSVFEELEKALNDKRVDIEGKPQ
ncbi:oxidoreductase-like protein [Mycena vulgaris]|nr:oxidoreductase-like protein [Mycena vulgaris]